MTCPAHEWTTIDDGATYTCTQCDTTTPGCQDCRRPLATSLAICDHCLTAARRIIDDIRHYLTQIPDAHREIMGLHAIRYDRSTQATRDDGSLPFGLDAAHDDDTRTGPASIRTPAGALDLLEQWVDAWADTSGHHDGVDHTLDYLHTHTLWAAQNLDHDVWLTYLAEARAVRAVVRRLAGLAPEPEPVPCAYCGGRIVHDITPTGLSDEARCTRCHTTWPTKARLDYTNLTHLRELPHTHPDTLVTAEQARAIYPDLKPPTLRKWVERGHVVAVGDDRHGASLYLLADIAKRHTPDNMSRGA